MENVVCDEESRRVDYADDAITENTRAAYPIDYIPNAMIPCTGRHPRDIIFLTCDAFGVLPPVSRLTPDQAMYHFMSGYTAKVAGTEMGVTEPEATFSACFGAAFMVWHPHKYAALLADKIRAHNAQVWLVNTGWTGGPYGIGTRFSLQHTRAIISAIHAGALADAPTERDPRFGFDVVCACPDVPNEQMVPRQTWADGAAYDKRAGQLAELFKANFAAFEDGALAAVKQAGPT